MKFAVCYSGQCRHPDKHFGGQHDKYIFNVLRQYGSIDFFLHFWKTTETIRGIILPDLNSEYKDKLLNLIKPKKYSFEDQQQIHRMISMYLSIYKCNELKKQFEQENRFKYDAVLRMRADFGFNHELPQYVLEQLDKIHVRDTGFGEGINDQFAIASSELMDIYANCFNNITDDLHSHPEKMLKKHFVLSGLDKQTQLLPTTFFWW